MTSQVQTIAPGVAGLAEAFQRVSRSAARPGTTLVGGLQCAACGRAFGQRRHAGMHRKVCLGGGGLRFLQQCGVMTRSADSVRGARLSLAVERCVSAAGSAPLRRARRCSAALRRAAGVGKLRISPNFRPLCGAAVAALCDAAAAGDAELRPEPSGGRPFAPPQRAEIGAMAAAWAYGGGWYRGRMQGVPTPHAVTATFLTPAADGGATFALRPISCVDRPADWPELAPRCAAWKTAPDKAVESCES
eukprot:TRINITY_DN6445_c0_g1_i1.p1 TRINITY_DN6445_c0_g1~~TRINITY_DN6445_c0_g1_i1.p1  ORF type:complete len:247 (+),score=49.53 TRINITY_DN6445_c0_g1_i1:118-858(+)